MKRYYILGLITIVVVKIFSSSLGEKIGSQSLAVRGTALLAFIVPVCLLLFFVSKDERIKKGFRTAAKIGMIFLVFCFIAGLLAEILTQ